MQQARPLDHHVDIGSSSTGAMPSARAPRGCIPTSTRSLRPPFGSDSPIDARPVDRRRQRRARPERWPATHDSTQAGVWLAAREPANGSVAAAGSGRPCDGCEQSVTADVMILATFRDGTILRFHQECFSAWETARAVSVMSPEDGPLANHTVDGFESRDDTGLTPGYAMSRVLITCPATNLPVPTGLSMDLEVFSMVAFDERFVDCPHCQLIHAWATDDAYLETRTTRRRIRTRKRQSTRRSARAWTSK